MSVSASGKRTDSDSLAVGCAAGAEGHGVLTFPVRLPPPMGRGREGRMPSRKALHFHLRIPMTPPANLRSFFEQ